MTCKLLSILLFIVLALGGCGKKVTQVTITEWEQYQDPYFKVHFKIPKGWHKVSEGAKVSFYTSQGALQKFYDPAAKEGEDGAQLVVVYERLDTVKPLASYMEDLKNDLNASGYNVKAVDLTTIEGVPASKISYNGRFDEKTTIEALRTLTIKDSVLYTATFAGFNDFFEPYKAVMDTFFATAELPKPKEVPADPSIPSTESDTFSNDILSISYPNNFEAVVPQPKGEVQFWLQIQGYRKDSNVNIDVRPAKKLTVEKVVDQNAKFFKPTSKGETTIDGLKAPYLNYSPAKEIESRAYFVVKNDNVYRIILNYHQPAKKIYLPAFEKAVASIRIK
ncbi:MAG: hypothetical protein AABZ02_07615 [Bacteroidota bacterium]